MAAGPRRGFDAVSFLTLYAVALIAIPSRFVVGPVGGAGSPAILLGLLGFAWWLYHQVRRSSPTGAGPQPLRTAALVFTAMVGVSYVAAMTRAIDGQEVSTAQLGPVVLLAWVGVLLVANDGVPDGDRFRTLLRRLVLLGGLEALLGIVQFFTHQTLVDRLYIPGLTLNQALGGFSARGGYSRPPGTSLHPIEFGAVLTMILPLAMNLALVDRTRSTFRRWWPVGAIWLAVFLSISRSALICALVGTLVVVVRWTPLARRVGLVVGLLGTGVLSVLAPGLLGTLVGLFTGISNDSSASSRVDSYAIAGEFIGRAPFFGRGYSTFLPSYRILDNQYLGLMIEIGFVGLAAFLLLEVVALRCARAVRRTAEDRETEQIGQGLLAAVAAGATGLAFYDGLGFPMAGGTLFFVLGLAGAGHRVLATKTGPSRRRQGPRDVARTAGRRP